MLYDREPHWLCIFSQIKKKSWRVSNSELLNSQPSTFPWRRREFTSSSCQSHLIRLRRNGSVPLWHTSLSLNRGRLLIGLSIQCLSCTAQWRPACIALFMTIETTNCANLYVWVCVCYLLQTTERSPYTLGVGQRREVSEEFELNAHVQAFLSL